ncbi:hypothetical protein AGMMS49965_24200 [Bacteroidia bacterium]|nr:hypothetical protein AGMMS49965_24200 [Bacteroidia bacterium]
MTRLDIEIVQKEDCIIVKSEKNFFSFSRNHTGQIKAFCTTDFNSAIVTDIILSGIASIMGWGGGTLTMSAKFGYNTEKMTEVVIAIFEKFDL